MDGGDDSCLSRLCFNQQKGEAQVWSVGSACQLSAQVLC